MNEYLTDAEREALFTAGDHHPDVCDCSAYAEEYAHEASDRMCYAFNETVVTVEAIVAAREKALRAEGEAIARGMVEQALREQREQIAQDIEAWAKPQVAVIRNTMEHAARIARGAR